ncbi:DEAD/DEAH box helicase [Pokkaliibacter sp. CJK22405]|uniref:DEAD/DEAH box helicase n=1 Tax=Pokkaliibacter sp. CJK22405 TaxID=3384615 RepID=UPI0039847E68
MSGFSELGLIPELLSTLDALNYQEATPVQAQAIPVILKGRDLIAGAQTGTGKTAGFTLPLLQKLSSGGKTRSNGVRALILAPTRELAEQILQAVQRYSSNLNLRSYAVYGGVSINPQMMAMRKGADILVATPGRLLDLYRSNALQFDQLEYLVLDEADRMLDLGFADELDVLFCALPRRRQTLLFSATFSERVKAMAGVILRDPARIEIAAPNSTADTLSQSLIAVDKKRKVELLQTLIRRHVEHDAAAQLLIFVKTRKSVDELESLLGEQGFNVGAIHGDKTQGNRMSAMQAFKKRETQILVATDVAARGLDVEELPLVINFELPINAEDYVHRIGRSGRKGKEGAAVSLVSADEVQQLAAIETLIGHLIERRDEPGFAPEHRLPETALGGQIIKKPKKPKKKTIPGSGQALVKPGEKPVRKLRFIDHLDDGKSSNPDRRRRKPKKK